MTVLQPHSLDKTENRAKSSQAHIPTFWSLPYTSNHFMDPHIGYGLWATRIRRSPCGEGFNSMCENLVPASCWQSECAELGRASLSRTPEAYDNCCGCCYQYYRYYYYYSYNSFAQLLLLQLLFLFPLLFPLLLPSRLLLLLLVTVAITLTLTISYLLQLLLRLQLLPLLWLALLMQLLLVPPRALSLLLLPLQL